MGDVIRANELDQIKKDVATLFDNGTFHFEKLVRIVTIAPTLIAMTEWAIRMEKACRGLSDTVGYGLVGMSVITAIHADRSLADIRDGLAAYPAKHQAFTVKSEKQQ